MTNYDLTIIGSGPGGYVAAIRAAQLGLKTAIIEKHATLGGTCLNVGCIPSKALLDSSEHFHSAKHNFNNHGIIINEPKVDFSKMMNRKNEVINQTCDGIKFLMKKNKIDIIQGLASFIDNNTIRVKDKTEIKIKSDKIIIATGSKPNFFPSMKPDGKRIITSTEALSLKEIPKNLLIIGGGVIGLELGSVYARLGSKVNVIEFADSIIPSMDTTLGKELTKVLKKEGFKFSLKHTVKQVINSGNSVKVIASDKKGKEVVFEGDYCLIAVGRKPYTKGLALENVGIKTDELGRVEVDSSLQTNIKNIYAIGDVIKGAMLAHKAEEEGVFVVESIIGEKPHINYNLIPGVVYTWPEVATVGQTEKQVIDSGIKYNVGQFPIRALGRARASMDIMGTIKIISDKKTDEVIGVHIIAPRAADLIMEAVVAMEFRASAEDIARICHPHPTYSEAMKEAALDATGKRPIHI